MNRPLNVFEAPLSGISLVEASAGTGKTYNITSLYIRAILEKDFSPSQVLVLTYTEAATAELKFRLRNRIKDSIKAINEGCSNEDIFLERLLEQNYPDAGAKLQTALDSFDEAAVFTIHGFCNRLLNEHSLQFGIAPGFEVVKDESELLRDCADEYWRNFIRSADKTSENRILLEYLIDEGFGPDELKSVLMEIINRPFAKLEPSNVNLDELKAHISNLQIKFEEMKKHWEVEADELKAILQSELLNKSSYKLDKREGLLNNLSDCLNDEIPKIKPFKELEKFGRKISQAGNKGHVFRELELSKAIDEYVEICEELQSLKPAFIIDSVEEIQNELTQKKDLHNVLSYNDFLLKVNSGLQNDSLGLLAGRLSKEYPMALVDEFQDTDPTQYSIFRQIYHEREDTALFMIGDPKQAIYGFRGADIYTYLEAKRDALDTQSYTLDYNYRSNDKMIAAVNEIFQQAELPFLIDGFSFNKAQFPPSKTEAYYLQSNDENINPLQCIKLEQDEKTNKVEIEEQIYEAIADEIVELLSDKYSLQEKPVEEKDIAILVRKGYQGENIQKKLRERGLKSVLKSRTSVFDTPEADELFMVLKSIQKLSYEPGIRAALTTELLGYRAVDILRLLNNETEWAAVFNQFAELKNVWEKKGIESAIVRLFQLYGTKKLLASKLDSERRITNLLHLAELLSKAEREHRLHGKSLLKWFYRKKNDDSSSSDEEELRLESDGDLIQISTIHAAKGLQYPIVFCPFLWDAPKSKNKNATFRFYKNGSVHIDINTGIDNNQRRSHKYFDLKEEMAEATRLAYVALTRSISACYLFIPAYKTLDLSPLASIVDGKELAEKRARASVLKEKNEAQFSYDHLIQKLSSCDHITLRKPNLRKQLSQKEDPQPKENLGKAVEFSRSDVFYFPRMLSYSSLAYGNEQNETTHDYDAVFEAPKSKLITYTRFSFPKGANAGTFLHQIFEDLVFKSPQNLEKVIKNNLEKYGFSEKWSPVIQLWIDEMLKHNFHKPDVSLNALEETDILKEMEFHFPVKDLQSGTLWELVRNKSGAEKDNFEEVSGFMKGFIDLIFRVGDKYFILDYKSNHLGDSPEDYSAKALKDEILHSAYDLQYHIYTVALHRFLKQKMADYSYNKHFGGILYMFLRGVDQNKPGSGMFFEKPEKQLIEKLDAYFKTGNRI
ncbi:MAG: exodeoxyribonuclease V subunit beta [Balneolaceae bacterium]